MIGRAAFFDLPLRCASCLVIVALTAASVFGQASHAELINNNGNFTLMRNGQPYFIQGAGGGASKQILRDVGGNSFRTWGASNIDDQLAEANKLGLTVTVGMWLAHDGQGFNYNNASAVAKQASRVRASVLKYKDNPAVLIWGLGNEMEGFKNGDDVAIWKSIEVMAAMIHKIDPNHPVMTVIAEIGGARVKDIDSLCPDIDIIGINSYGGGASLADRYRKLGATKPFVITEFGPAGTWEIGRNPFGAPLELTSTQKAAAYRATYEKSVLAEKGKLCLGSYAFSWGAKQEATATWYGLFLADGTRLEAVDTLSELWTDKKPANRCPQIEPLKVQGSAQVNPGDTVQISLSVTDPENDLLTVKWVMTKEASKYDTGGEVQAAPPSFADAFVTADIKSATIRMPKVGGRYRVYAYVYDKRGGAAMANVPLLVGGPKSASSAKTPNA